MPRTKQPPRLPLVLLEALFPSPQLLTGRLAASTVAMYTRDCGAYVAFCGYDGGVALQAETLRRWRTYLAADTVLSPHTINRMLAAVKRVLKEAAVQGIVDRDGAGACAEVEGVSVAALRHRLKTTARVRLTPAQMRQLCETPDPATLLGLRDRALLATLAGSGCRISEVVALTVGQLSARDGGYVLQVLGKGQAAPREAPLSQEAARTSGLAGAAGRPGRGRDARDLYGVCRAAAHGAAADGGGGLVCRAQVCFAVRPARRQAARFSPLRRYAARQARYPPGAEGPGA